MPVSPALCSRCTKPIRVFHDPGDDLTAVVCVVCEKRQERAKAAGRKGAIKRSWFPKAKPVPAVEVGGGDAHEGSD